MTSRTANATPVPTSAIVRPRMPRASSGRGRGSAPASPEPSSLDMPGCCHGRRCPPRGPTRGSGGWPGASQPPAPTDPGVTVSRHRALLTSRSERTNPSPMGEQAGFSLEEPGPPPLEPLVGPQPPVLLPSPAPQVEADAPEEGIHLRLPHHRLGNRKRLVLGLWHVPSIPPGAGAPVDRTEHPW